jgi:O-methyltransferase
MAYVHFWTGARSRADTVVSAAPDAWNIARRKMRSVPLRVRTIARSKPRLVAVGLHGPLPLRLLAVKIGLRPTLVPIARLESSYAQILGRLGDVTRPLVYLEFGVSQGSSMLCMHRALQTRSDGDAARLVGFDSFEGLPPETDTVSDQGGSSWRPGDFASPLAYTSAYLRSHGVRRDRVELVKGWFDDSLTETTRTRLGLTGADVIMIDCDIYTAAISALRFCAPLIGERTVLVFDDWNDDASAPIGGEERAFLEFLAENPSINSRPLPECRYQRYSRVFELTRRGVQT